MNPSNNNIEEPILAIVDATATTAANWDVRGRGSWATVRVLLSAGLNTNAVAPTISILESDDTVVTNFATIVADRTIALDNDTVTNIAMQTFHVDLRGRKRYLRLKVTPGTVASNDAVAISACGTIHNVGGYAPSSTTGMVGGSTTDQAVVI